MTTRAVSVLVIEDDSNYRELLQMALNEVAPHDVVHAVDDGVEAVAYLSGHGRYADRSMYPLPHYILTDLKMPRKDGFALLKELRSHPAWEWIPVVVLSSSSDGEDIRRAYRLGANAYHAKPGSFSGLRSLLGNLHPYWRSCLAGTVQRNNRPHASVSPHVTVGRREESHGKDARA